MKIPQGLGKKSRRSLAWAGWVLVFLAPLPAPAQQISRIVGQVYLPSGDIESGGASVTIYTSTRDLVDTTFTDTRGHFYFMGVPAGEYILVVTKPGHLISSQVLKVLFGILEQSVTVFLTPESVWRSGKGKATVTAAEMALPSKVRNEFEKGKKAVKKEKYDDAIRHLEAVIEAQPQFALGFEVLGVAYLRARRESEAEQAFERALKLEPKQSECYIQMGLLRYDQQRYDESTNLLRSGLGIDPNSWFGHYQLGLTYFALKDYSKSADELHRAEELDPDFAEVHVRLANVYLRRGNPAMAFTEFENYLKKDPKGRFAARVRETLGEMRTAGIKPPPS